MPRLKHVSGFDPPAARRPSNDSRRRTRQGTVIAVGMGTAASPAGGPRDVQGAPAGNTPPRQQAVLTSVGCIGICAREPLVESAREASRFSTQYLGRDGGATHRRTRRKGPGRQGMGRRPHERRHTGQRPGLRIPIAALLKDQPFFGKQTPHRLQNCGVIDPEQIDEYIARDGYHGLARCSRK